MWFRAFVALLAVALAAPVVAQTNISPSIVAESLQPKPGGSTFLAIRMTPAPEWHGYWKNPGDAGVGAQFQWSLPAGVKVGDARYPVPQTLIISGLMNHVYKGEHVLLVPLSLANTIKAGTDLPVRVKLQWLACTDRICVPEQGKLSIALKAGDGTVSPESRTLFDTWLTKLPRPLGSRATHELVGKRLRISLPFPEGATVANPHLFAETENAIAYAANQSWWRDGESLVLETDAGAQTVPDSIRAVVATGDGSGLEIETRAGSVPTGGLSLNGGDASGRGTAWLTLASLVGALLGGLILNIMPCVFPIISLKAVSLARAGGNETAAKREALSYTAGVILTCLALGGALLGLREGGVVVGWAFQLQNPWMIGLLLLLSIAITLNLAGFFHLRGFGGGEALAGQGGTRGAFWTGALAAFVATPCTGPFMAAALGAALVLPTGAALAIFAGLGLGLALPFLGIAYVPALRRLIPKPGGWMVRFQRAMAVPMLITAVALAWLLWRQVSPSSAIGAGVERSIAFSESKLSAMRGEGKRVFLYFTADWCVSCKVNEKAAISRDEVQKAFRSKDIEVMVGDWTRGDPAITRFLESQGRSGVPLYLYYPKGGAQPQILPQLLTPSMLTALN